MFIYFEVCCLSLVFIILRNYEGTWILIIGIHCRTRWLVLSPLVVISKTDSEEISMSSRNQKNFSFTPLVNLQRKFSYLLKWHLISILRKVRILSLFRSTPALTSSKYYANLQKMPVIVTKQKFTITVFVYIIKK